MNLELSPALPEGREQNEDKGIKFNINVNC